MHRPLTRVLIACAMALVAPASGARAELSEINVAQQYGNRDKRAAAEAYVRISRDRDSVDNIEKMMNDPGIVYTTTPQNIQKFAEFMAMTGAIKGKPESWKDMFFPNVHNLPGS